MSGIRYTAISEILPPETEWSMTHMGLADLAFDADTLADRLHDDCKTLAERFQKFATLLTSDFNPWLSSPVGNTLSVAEDYAALRAKDGALMQHIRLCLGDEALKTFSTALQRARQR